MKNFVGQFVIQCNDEVSAIDAAKTMAQCLQKITQSNIPEFVGIGPPSEPCFEVSSDGGILFKKSKVKKS